MNVKTIDDDKNNKVGMRTWNSVAIFVAGVVDNLVSSALDQVYLVFSAPLHARAESIGKFVQACLILGGLVAVPKKLSAL